MDHGRPQSIDDLKKTLFTVLKYCASHSDVSAVMRLTSGTCAQSSTKSTLTISIKNFPKYKFVPKNMIL